MNKFLLSCMSLLALAAPQVASGAELTLTAASFGITSSNSAYAVYNISDETSGFSFNLVGNYASGNIGMTINKGCQLVMTANSNNHEITEIEVTYGASIAGQRKISFYKNEAAYTAASSTGTANVNLAGTLLGESDETNNNASFTSEVNAEYFGFAYTGTKSAVQIKSVVIKYNDGSAPVYPTECEDPVFSFNGKGLLPTETAVDGYAGNTVSVACPTKKSEIVWSVSVNSGAKQDLTELSYQIPEDAGAGDVYEFTAQAMVEGENDIIESAEVKLTLTVLEFPLEGIFYTPSVTDAPVWGKKLENASGVSGGSNNTKTNALCGVEGGFNSGAVNITFSDSDGSNFAYINGSNTISIYKGNTFVISVAEGYRITEIGFDKSNSNLTSEAGVGTFANGTWSSTEGEDVSKVKFTYSATASSNWTSNCISTIKVTYEEAEAISAPAVPALMEGSDFTIDGGYLNAENKSIEINFMEADGIDIYYRVGTEENKVETKVCDQDHTGYTKHDGTPITLTTAHKTISYYACDPATGLHSEPVMLALTIGTGVDEFEVEGGVAEYFNLQGARVANPESGLYIRVINGKAEKVLVK